MRARGANVTDIVVLVVAADDGVMPQTIEAIQHARAAGSADRRGGQQDRQARCRPGPGSQRPRQAERHPRGMGRRHDVRQRVGAQRARASTSCSRVHPAAGRSARPQGADSRASPSGVVLESSIEKGRGAVATVLVKRGTLKTGDPIIAGQEFGRVRAMFDATGKQVADGRSVRCRCRCSVSRTRRTPATTCWSSRASARRAKSRCIARASSATCDSPSATKKVEDVFSQMGENRGPVRQPHRQGRRAGQRRGTARRADRSSAPTRCRSRSSRAAWAASPSPT